MLPLRWRFYGPVSQPDFQKTGLQGFSPVLLHPLLSIMSNYRLLGALSNSLHSYFKLSSPASWTGNHLLWSQACYHKDLVHNSMKASRWQSCSTSILVSIILLHILHNVNCIDLSPQTCIPVAMVTLFCITKCNKCCGLFCCLLQVHTLFM